MAGNRHIMTGGTASGGWAAMLRPFRPARSAVAALTLATALLLCSIFGAAPSAAYADEASGTQRQSAASSAQGEGGTTLELYRNHAEDSAPFQVGSMLPGDEESQAFFLRVSYQGSVTVKFHAEIRPGHDGLADVLKCRISLRDGEMLYDGLMRDMPAALDYALPQSSGTTEELVYDIVAYLETSVGNDYASEELVADFQWWVEADGSGGSDGSGSDGGSGGSAQGGLIMPQTGDGMTVAALVTLICMLLAAGAALLYARSGEGAWVGSFAAGGSLVAAAGSDGEGADGPGGSRKTRKRLALSAGAAVVLALCLGGITYALVNASASAPDNRFQTGIVKINLNDGEPIIQAQKFEPGMEVEESFFIENTGSADAWCKVYFSDVRGGLSDALIVRISDGSDVLFEGAPADLSRDAVAAMALGAGEKRTLTASFLYPKAAGSEGQGEELSFKLAASATQMKNNPGGLFE